MPSLDKTIFSSIKEDISGYKTFVETGTLYGDTMNNMAGLFDKLYSIEIDKVLYDKAKQKFSDHSKMEFIHGDSSIELKELIGNLKSNTVFFLDGHYSAGVTSYGIKHVPLYEELSSIEKLFSHNAIIIIDDVRLFGKFNGGKCDWRDINIKNCLEILKDRMNLHYFLPSKLNKNDRLIIHLNRIPNH